MKAIFLLGPTASGKTALALALADRFPVEIISVDSALVYRDMNIGTAKPDPATLARYPHHLINLVAPDEAYSAARFCRDALPLLENIVGRGKVPLLVGGTMLYAHALLNGLSDIPEADAEIRRRIDQRAASEGWPALHAELARVDATTAARLKPNDSQRIQRALEVYQLTGTPISALQDRASRVSPFPYRKLIIGLVPSDRAVLHERIGRRFDAMLKAGLVDEVKSLRHHYRLTPDLPSMRCVGYRQAWEYLEGAIDENALREKSVAATRQLAKRQLTWLRSMADVAVTDCMSGELVPAVTAQARHFLGA